jgi:hypothetical protein
MMAERIDDPTEFFAHLKENLEAYYSDFVTRFTIEFAGELLPWWRVRAHPAASKGSFAPDIAPNKQLSKAVAASIAGGELVAEDGEIRFDLFLESTGHAQLAPDSYQYLWTVALAKDKLKDNDALLEILTKDTLGPAKTKLCDAINAASLVRNYAESIGGGWAQHNSDACSNALREVLDRFRWFDSPGAPAAGLFCDAPFPNLVTDLFMGVYGYPYHVNVEKLRRIEYTAKLTPMYTDVFVLDQCRYMYDLVPTIEFFRDGLPYT